MNQHRVKGKGRKPADLAAAIRYGNQEAIWPVVRRLRVFTVADVVCKLAGADYAVSEETVKSYLERLARGGYLKCATVATHRGACRLNHYTLAKDGGVEAPRLRRDGTPSAQGRGTENLWRSMKILKTFTPLELAVAATTDETSVGVATAKAYVKHLYRAGYLVLMEPSQPGQQARYRLIPSKWSGPLAPQIQRIKRVFDPNLKQVVWGEDDAIDG